MIEIIGLWSRTNVAEYRMDAIVDTLEMAHKDGYEYVSAGVLADMVGAPMNGAFMGMITHLQSVGVVVAFRVRGGRERVLVALADTVDRKAEWVGKFVSEESIL